MSSISALFHPKVDLMFKINLANYYYPAYHVYQIVKMVAESNIGGLTEVGCGSDFLYVAVHKPLVKITDMLVPKSNCGKTD